MKFTIIHKRSGKEITHTSAGLGWPDSSEIRLRPNGDLVIQEDYGEAVLNPSEYIVIPAGPIVEPVDHNYSGSADDGYHNGFNGHGY